MSAHKYNSKSPAVKRILQEAKELQLDPCPDYHAQPLEDNIFEWHFTIRGADGTEFGGGRYHGRIILPNDYPFQPPNLMLLTPNGRFELNKKICLSITGYHPEFWQPAWGIRTVLLGIMGFFPTKANGAIGGIDYTETERKQLAKQSRSWKCDKCDNCNIDVLPDQIEKPPNDAAGGNRLGGAGDIPQFNFAYEGEKQKNSEVTAAGSRAAEHKQSNPLDGESPSQETSAIPALQEGWSSTASPSKPSSKSEPEPEPEPENLSLTFRAASPLPTPTSQARDLRLQRRASPIWIDTVILGLLVLLIGLLARKFIG